jgi:hypothetical protein
MTVKQGGSSSGVANERTFSFLPLNERPGKPRPRGITEIYGPYYTRLGDKQKLRFDDWVEE